MAFKSVLTHAEPVPAAAPRLATAASLARKWDAVLVGVGAESFDWAGVSDPYGVSAGQWLAVVVEQIQADLVAAEKAFLKQRQHVLQFARGEFEFTLTRLQLLLHAAEVILQLLDALLKHSLFALAAGAARNEQCVLRLEHTQRLRIGLARCECGWQCECRTSVAFRLQPQTLRQRIERASARNGDVGTHLRIVELDEQIAGFDPIAVLHENPIYDAAVEMLHRLGIAFDSDGPVGDDRAVD